MCVYGTPRRNRRNKLTLRAIQRRLYFNDKNASEERRSLGERKECRRDKYDGNRIDEYIVFQTADSKCKHTVRF